MVRVTTDAVYRRPGQRFAHLLAQAGGRVTEYEIDWHPVGSRFGACHCIELPLLFPSRTGWRHAAILGETCPDQLAAVGAPIRKLWADFARTGAVAAVPTAGPHDPHVVLRRHGPI
jgi:para-nitrobenzyl esterase